MPADVWSSSSATVPPRSHHFGNLHHHLCHYILRHYILRRPFMLRRRQRLRHRIRSPSQGPGRSGNPLSSFARQRQGRQRHRSSSSSSSSSSRRSSTRQRWRRRQRHRHRPSSQPARPIPCWNHLSVPTAAAARPPGAPTGNAAKSTSARPVTAEERAASPLGSRASRIRQQR